MSQFRIFTISILLLVLFSIRAQGQEEDHTFTGQLTGNHINISFEVPDGWFLPEIRVRDAFFTKEQAIFILSIRSFVPEGEPTYSWTLYAKDDEYALLLYDVDNAAFFAIPDEPLQALDLDSTTPPDTIGEYTRLTREERTDALPEIQYMAFGPSDAPITLIGRDKAAHTLPKYVYMPEEDRILDQETDEVYPAVELGYVGQFISEAGEGLEPAYTFAAVSVTVEEYIEIATNEDVLLGGKGALMNISASPTVPDEYSLDVLAEDAETRIQGTIELGYDFAETYFLSEEELSGSVYYTYDGGVFSFPQSCIYATKTVKIVNEVYAAFVSLCAVEEDAAQYEETVMAVLDSIEISPLK